MLGTSNESDPEMAIDQWAIRLSNGQLWGTQGGGILESGISGPD